MGNEDKELKKEEECFSVFRVYSFHLSSGHAATLEIVCVLAHE